MPTIIYDAALTSSGTSADFAITGSSVQLQGSGPGFAALSHTNTPADATSWRPLASVSGKGVVSADNCSAWGRVAWNGATSVTVSQSGAAGSGGSGGGDASAANQTAGNNTLTAISAKLPATLGPKSAALSLSIAQPTNNYTERSGSIATGGAAQQLAAANANRLGWKIQNTSTQGPLYFNASGTASTAGASFMLSAATATAAGGYYESPPGGQSLGAISILGATTGQTFAAREW